MRTNTIPLPIVVREDPRRDGVFTFKVDVYFVLRCAVALLFAGTGATAILASIVSVYVLNLDQFLAMSAMLIGFSLIGIGALIVSYALKEYGRAL